MTKQQQVQLLVVAMQLFGTCLQASDGATAKGADNPERIAPPVGQEALEVSPPRFDAVQEEAGQEKRAAVSPPLVLPPLTQFDGSQPLFDAAKPEPQRGEEQGRSAAQGGSGTTRSVPSIGTAPEPVAAELPEVQQAKVNPAGTNPSRFSSFDFDLDASTAVDPATKTEISLDSQRSAWLEAPADEDCLTLLPHGEIAIEHAGHSLGYFAGHGGYRKQRYREAGSWLRKAEVRRWGNTVGIYAWRQGAHFSLVFYVPYRDLRVLIVARSQPERYTAAPAFDAWCECYLYDAESENTGQWYQHRNLFGSKRLEFKSWEQARDEQVVLQAFFVEYAKPFIKEALRDLPRANQITDPLFTPGE